MVPDLSGSDRSGIQLAIVTFASASWSDDSWLMSAALAVPAGAGGAGGAGDTGGARVWARSRTVSGRGMDDHNADFGL